VRIGTDEEIARKKSAEFVLKLAPATASARNLGRENLEPLPQKVALSQFLAVQPQLDEVPAFDRDAYGVHA
jgi:hypothetical protein